MKRAYGVLTIIILCLFVLLLTAVIITTRHNRYGGDYWQVPATPGAVIG